MTITTVGVNARTYDLGTPERAEAAKKWIAANSADTKRFLEFHPVDKTFSIGAGMQPAK
ncbi:MAG: hypothetical protein ACOH2S_20440 [Janthinobacterium svalbardensis]